MESITSSQFAILRLQNKLAFVNHSILNIVGYLSTPGGQENLSKTIKETSDLLEPFKTEKICDININISQSGISRENGSIRK